MMATKSTPAQNDPDLDNRSEYTPPPCVEECPDDSLYNEDGLAVDIHGNLLPS